MSHVGLNLPDKELDLLCSTLDAVQERHDLNRRDAMCLIFWMGTEGLYGTKPDDIHCREKVEEAKQTIREILDGASGRSRTGGFLYFVESEENSLFKIGMTRGSPMKRLPTIQTGCPYEIRLHSAIYYENCHKKEREFHNLLAEYRTRGEWYKIDVLILEELIIQEITKSHISDTNASADTIVPTRIIEEADHRLTRIGITLSDRTWPWFGDDSQEPDPDTDIGLDIEGDPNQHKRRVQ